MTDDAVLDGIALEVDVIEMDRKDIFIEDIQIIWPNPGAESFVIVGVSSDIFLMKRVAIFDGDDHVDGVFGNGVGIFCLWEDS